MTNTRATSSKWVQATCKQEYEYAAARPLSHHACRSPESLEQMWRQLPADEATQRANASAVLDAAT